MAIILYMEDERFKGVVTWVKQYKVNPAYIEWLKENDPVAYQEIIKSQEVKNDTRTD